MLHIEYKLHILFNPSLLFEIKLSPKLRLDLSTYFIQPQFVI